MEVIHIMENNKSKMCNCGCHNPATGKILHCIPCCDYCYQKQGETIEIIEGAENNNDIKNIN